MFRRFIFRLVVAYMAMCSVALSATEIREIEIQGNGRMSDVAVKSLMSYREGDVIGDTERQEMIQELEQSKIFSKVNITLQGQKMIVSVKEYPLINDFVFTGNKVVKTDDIISSLGVKVRDSYTPEVKETILTRLQDIYQLRGFYLAKITLKEEQKLGNRVNLNFDVVEGDIATIKTIRFEGNNGYDDGDLRDVISSKENAWYRFLTDDDIYDDARANVDSQMLEYFYRNRGYPDIRTMGHNATLSADKKSFDLVYTLDEGKRYRIGKTYISNPHNDMDMDKFTPILDANKGKKGYYYADGIDDMLKDLANEMSRQGIPFVDFDTELKRYVSDSGLDTVDVNVILKDGIRAFIERIEIRGNYRTLDKVIRRELEMTEGDPFNAAVVRASERNIRQLGFFNDVKFSFEQASSADRIILYIDVEEKTTGSVGFGIGYSNVGGALFKINIKEDNFLGRGQKASFEIERSKKNLDFKVGFSEPRFRGRKLTAGIELSNSNVNLMSSRSYRARSTKVKVYASYDLNKKWSQTWDAELEKYNVYEVGTKASAAVKSEQGTTNGLSLSQTLAYADVDDYFNPTKGIKASLRTRARSLGNKYQNFKIDLGGTYYYPITENIVWSVNGSYTKVFGYKELRMSDRLYLNSDYIRGFRKVGIMDKTSGDLIGGTSRIILGTELDFPVFLPKSTGIKGSIFTTVAKLGGAPKTAGVTPQGDGNIRWVAGAGIKWASPIGPMRFDFTRVLKKGERDTRQSFLFTIGWSLY